jgi:hypothetical protein
MPVIPTTLEIKIGRIVVSGLPWQKVRFPISTNKPSVVAHIFNPSYMVGISRKIKVQG